MKLENGTATQTDLMIPGSGLGQRMQEQLAGCYKLLISKFKFHSNDNVCKVLFWSAKPFGEGKYGKMLVFFSNNGSVL